MSSNPTAPTNYDKKAQCFKCWAFFHVRPAWAHSWRCKSSRELVTVSEVKRNCMRVTDCGEEAWIVNCEPMYKNQIEGVVEQGERA